MSFDIAVDDPRRPDVTALLAAHHEFALATTPREYMRALDVDGLLAPGVTFYSARRHGELLGVGALKKLDGDTCEVKSMHTARAARGQGVGRAILEHVLAEARIRGFRRINLDTGTHADFEPARALYRSVGFEPCPPYADYLDSPYNTCMTLNLE